MKCIECGIEFTPDKLHTFQKTCSAKCYNRGYKRKNRKRISDYERERYHKNPRKAQLQHEKYLQKLRMEIFQLLGNKCSNPNCLIPGRCSDLRCLQIDHINGGGNQERKEAGGTFPYYRLILKKLKEGSLDYQLLCANCNWIKKCEQNENAWSIIDPRRKQVK